MRLSDITATRHRGPTRSRTPALARAAMTAFASGFLACVLSTGCGNAARRFGRQMDWVADNPKAPRPVIKAVLGKKLQEGVGMTTGAVVASWGKPHEKLDFGGGDARWIYRRGQFKNTGRVVIVYTLIFNRGYLTKVLQSEGR